MTDTIKELWPIVAFALAAVWGLIVWMKRQFLDNVYATKKEVRSVQEELETKMTLHETHDAERYESLTNQMNSNHDEIKDLIIRHLAKS